MIPAQEFGVKRKQKKLQIVISTMNESDEMLRQTSKET